MTEADVAAEGALRDTVQWLSVLPWPLPKQQLLDLAADRGWTVTADRPGKGAEWETGLIRERAEAWATVLDGFVAKLTLITADVPGEETRESKRLLRDAFAVQVALVSEVLGEPLRRKPGGSPLAEWDLASGAALVVQAGVSCLWVVTSPEFVEIERDPRL